MAKVELTERQKRWAKTVEEFKKTRDDPENAGASRYQMYIAVGKKMKLSHETVRKIVERELKD